MAEEGSEPTYGTYTPSPGFPVRHSAMKRYVDADNRLTMPLEDIIRLEESFHDPGKTDPKHWDGKSLAVNLPF